MEWVETTGRTLADAKEAALDQLGVDESDAEFEVLEEPRSGLFGRLRGEARVRARVRPTSPRPKAERRDRRKRRESPGQGRGSSSQGGSGSESKAQEPKSTAGATGPTDSGREGRSRRGGRGRGGGGGGGDRQRSGATKTDESTGTGTVSDQEGTTMGNDATVEEQAAITRTFLTGLVEAFDLDFELREERVDDENIELSV